MVFGMTRGEPGRFAGIIIFRSLAGVWVACQSAGVIVTDESLSFSKNEKAAVCRGKILQPGAMLVFDTTAAAGR
jgi:hypothetical protein